MVGGGKLNGDGRSSGEDHGVALGLECVIRGSMLAAAEEDTPGSVGSTSTALVTPTDVFLFRGAWLPLRPLPAGISDVRSFVRLGRTPFPLFRHAMN